MKGTDGITFRSTCWCSGRVLEVEVQVDARIGTSGALSVNVRRGSRGCSRALRSSSAATPAAASRCDTTFAAVQQPTLLLSK